MNIFVDMKCKVIFTIWLICSLSTYAQIDKRFWFAAPDISNQHADRPIYTLIKRYQVMEKPNENLFA